MVSDRIYVGNFSFSKPVLLKENEYLGLKSRLPIYPVSENIPNVMLKEYWWYIIALFPPIFVMLVINELTGNDSSPFKHAKLLKVKNQFYYDYYTSIYQSKDYTEYCKINSDLPKVKPMTREEQIRIFGTTR